jgi:hypothetical protein
MKNMKKYIKQFFALALVVSFASCDSDAEKVEMLSAGGSASIKSSQSTISRLDTNVPIIINFIEKAGVTATKVEIFRNIAASSSAAIKLGDKVSDATIVTVEGVTSATYNSSTLGSFDVFPVKGTDGTTTLTGKTGTFALAIVSTFSDGTTTTIPYTQTVAKGIVWKVDDGHGGFATSSKSGVTSFQLNDPTPVKINFAAVYKVPTTLTSIVGTWSKKTVAGTITTGALPGTIALSTAVKTVDIAAIDYSTYGGLAIGDKITYKYTVTAGTQTDVISTEVTIATQSLGDEIAATLSDDLTSNKFSLKTGMNYANTDTTNGEIIFATPFGIAKEGTTVIDFVKSNTTDYAKADLFKVKAAYDAGTKVTSLTGLAMNDVVVYKIVRGTGSSAVTSYGIIKVGDVHSSTVNADTTNSFGFVYKEGYFM